MLVEVPPARRGQGVGPERGDSVGHERRVGVGGPQESQGTGLPTGFFFQFPGRGHGWVFPWLHHAPGEFPDGPAQSMTELPYHQKTRFSGIVGGHGHHVGPVGGVDQDEPSLGAVGSPAQAFLELKDPGGVHGLGLEGGEGQV